MKSGRPERKKTIRLHLDEDIKFILFGISSHENDYRLVWAINNQLNMQFSRTENLVIHQSKLKRDLEFSRYVYTDEDKYLKYCLISNRCPDGFLFPELKNLDFLIKIVGESNEALVRKAAILFRKIDIVSAIYKIEPQSLKDIEKINFD
jgi:hypothetical protein